MLTAFIGPIRALATSLELEHSILFLQTQGSFGKELVLTAFIGQIRGLAVSIKLEHSIVASTAHRRKGISPPTTLRPPIDAP